MAQAEILSVATADPFAIGINADTDPLMASDGNIYGVMNAFGPLGGGSIFEYNVMTQQMSVVYAFPYVNFFPNGRVFVDPSGNIFGTQVNSVFEYSPSTGILTTLPVDPSLGSAYEGFDGNASGSAFCATVFGSNDPDGAIVAWNTSAQSLDTVAVFSGADGSDPDGVMYVDADGDVFGTTFAGGTSNAGAIYEIAANSSTIKVLYNFPGGSGGINPQGGLVADAAGNLYGTASDGAASGGIVYELTAQTHQFEVLATLAGTTPMSAPIVDAAGDVFGLGYGGGANGDGTVFEIAAGSGSATVIASFTTAGSGVGSLVADSFGDLYGVSDNIDGNGDSGVFEIANSGFQTAAQCYCPGTLIATRHGERSVESLQIGEHVLTLDGAERPIRWIGRRSYDGRFIAGQTLALPVCIKADAVAPGQPSQDLWVSPGHAVFIEGHLIPAWRLINGVSIVQAEAVERVEYLHIELDRHDVVFANGLPAESYLDEGGRSQFHNAAEFDGPAKAGAPFAPRLEHGFALDRIQRQIALRAGLFMQRLAGPGQLHGYIDGVDGDVVQGWAQDAAHPGEAVTLAMPDGATVLANLYRPDLQAAGIGSGCHGFRVRLAQPPAGPIAIHRAGDMSPLPMTDAVLQRLGLRAAA